MKSQIKLRLFVSGQTQTASRAIDNLKAVCNDPEVTKDYAVDIDIVDVNESPGAAEKERILVTPTLLKKLPRPVQRVVGDLSNRADIFITLDITPPRASGKTASGDTV